MQILFRFQTEFFYLFTFVTSPIHQIYFNVSFFKTSFSLQADNPKRNQYKMMELLMYLINGIGFIPILLIKINKIPSQKAITPFLWLVSIICAIEIAGTVILYHTKLLYVTGYIFMIYTLLEFLTICFYFRHTLNPLYRSFFKASTAAFIILYSYFVYTWNIDDCLKTDSYLSLFETFFVIICTFLWFKNNFVNSKKTTFLDVPDFYFVFGFVFYFSLAIVLFLLTDYLAKRGYEMFWDYYIYNFLFCALWRILLIIGVWKAKTN